MSYKKVKLKDLKIAITDTETTGLSKTSHEVIEVAVGIAVVDRPALETDVIDLLTGAVRLVHYCARQNVLEAGENIFIVQQGRLLTPPASASILSGITRNTIIHLAADMGIDTLEQTIAREQLYAADEVFMTGTAAEVTPVRQVDHMTIGNGGCGTLTRKIQDAFFGLFNGQTRDSRNWLEPL